MRADFIIIPQDISKREIIVLWNVTEMSFLGAVRWQDCEIVAEVISRIDEQDSNFLFISMREIIILWNVKGVIARIEDPIIYIPMRGIIFYIYSYERNEL